MVFEIQGVEIDDINAQKNIRLRKNYLKNTIYDIIN